jgi:hypothetical protein
MKLPRFSLRRLLIATACFSVSAGLLVYEGSPGGHGGSYSWLSQKIAGLIFIVAGLTTIVGRAAVYVAIALLLIYGVVLRTT